MSQFSTVELKLAFTRHVLDQIQRADSRILQAETDFLERTCPTSVMEEHGLLSGGKVTQRFQVAKLYALERLPLDLELDEKLALVTTFLEMCVVDGELHAGEGSLLFQAAQLLAVTPQQFDRHLDTLTDQVGAVELDPDS